MGEFSTIGDRSLGPPIFWCSFRIESTFFTFYSRFLRNTFLSARNAFMSYRQSHAVFFFSAGRFTTVILLNKGVFT